MPAREHHVASKMAKAVAFLCLKEVMKKPHSTGERPVSMSGDYTDVFVTDGQGNQIGWAKCCRLLPEEQERIQCEVVCGIYDFLLNLENDAYETALAEAYKVTINWKDPNRPRRIQKRS